MFDEQGGHCAYCGIEMTLERGFQKTATIDHIVPRSTRPKLKHEFNEVAACYRCNQIKGSKPLFKVIFQLKCVDPAND